MHKKQLSVAITVVISIFISGCISDAEDEKDLINPIDSPEIPSRGFFMGILPIPGNGQSFDTAFRQASEYSEFVPIWGRPSPFYNLADDLSSGWGITFIDGYVRGNYMFPLIHVNFFGKGVTLVIPPDMDEATLSTPEWRQRYKEAVLDVVRVSKPLYLSIGNEVNRWYEKYGVSEENPNGFQYYVSLYNEIYDAVKEISPKTKVFCTFAREIVSENREADLSVLSLFNPDKIDILVFTSYPYSVKGINKVSDIPDNYYAKAFNYISKKPLGFSELGWPSIKAFGGEEEQANFIFDVSHRLTRNQGLDLHLFGWAWLHDLDEKDAIGLIKRDGTEKIGYKVWKTISISGMKNIILQAL